MKKLMLILVAMIIAVACSKDDDLNGYDGPNGSGNGDNGNNNDTVICVINPNDSIYDDFQYNDVRFDIPKDSSDIGKNINDLSNIRIEDVNLDNYDSISITFSLDNVKHKWDLEACPLRIYIGNSDTATIDNNTNKAKFNFRISNDTDFNLYVKSTSNNSNLACYNGHEVVGIEISYTLHINVYKCEDI